MLKDGKLCFSDLMELQKQKTASEEKRKVLKNAVLVAAERIGNVVKDLCRTGVHLCHTLHIETPRGYILANKCGFCGRIVSAEKIIYHGNWYIYAIPEDEYSQLLCREKVDQTSILQKFNIYLENKDRYNGEKEYLLEIMFANKYLLEYYRQIDFENTKVKSLLEYLKKALEEKDRASKDLFDFIKATKTFLWL